MRGVLESGRATEKRRSGERGRQRENEGAAVVTTKTGARVGAGSEGVGDCEIREKKLQ